MLIYILSIVNAGVAELADALDLGSSVFDVGVQVLSPAPLTNPFELNIYSTENQPEMVDFFMDAWALEILA